MSKPGFKNKISEHLISKYKSYKKSNSLSEKNSSKNGLDIGWTRATFIVKEELLKKIKDAAYWERKTVKVVINDALNSFFNKQKHIEKSKK
ncbi:MAG: hypothetical protein WDZ41_03510 [Candidatus Babeliales bacterium]